MEVSSMRIAAAFFLGMALLAGSARAEEEEEDVTKFYDLKTEATPKVAKGASGKVKIDIVAKAGAHVDKDAPIEIVLKAPKGVTLSKTKLGKKEADFRDASAFFDVAFTGKEAGKGEVEAELSFYVWTDKICAKQERTAKLPVSVE